MGLACSTTRRHAGGHRHRQGRGAFSQFHDECDYSNYTGSGSGSASNASSSISQRPLCNLSDIMPRIYVPMPPDVVALERMQSYSQNVHSASCQSGQSEVSNELAGSRSHDVPRTSPGVPFSMFDLGDCEALLCISVGKGPPMKSVARLEQNDGCRCFTDDDNHDGATKSFQRLLFDDIGVRVDLALSATGAVAMSLDMDRDDAKMFGCCAAAISAELGDNLRGPSKLTETTRICSWCCAAAISAQFGDNLSFMSFEMGREDAKMFGCCAAISAQLGDNLRVLENLELRGTNAVTSESLALRGSLVWRMPAAAADVDRRSPPGLCAPRRSPSPLDIAAFGPSPPPSQILQSFRVGKRRSLPLLPTSSSEDSFRFPRRSTSPLGARNFEQSRSGNQSQALADQGEALLRADARASPLSAPEPCHTNASASQHTNTLASQQTEVPAATGRRSHLQSPPGNIAMASSKVCAASRGVYPICRSPSPIDLRAFDSSVLEVPDCNRARDSSISVADSEAALPEADDARSAKRSLSFSEGSQPTALSPSPIDAENKVPPRYSHDGAMPLKNECRSPKSDEISLGDELGSDEEVRAFGSRQAADFSKSPGPSMGSAVLSPSPLELSPKASLETSLKSTLREYRNAVEPQDKTRPVRDAATSSTFFSPCTSLSRSESQHTPCGSYFSDALNHNALELYDDHSAASRQRRPRRSHSTGLLHLPSHDEPQQVTGMNLYEIKGPPDDEDVALSVTDSLPSSPSSSSPPARAEFPRILSVNGNSVVDSPSLLSLPPPALPLSGDNPVSPAPSDTPSQMDMAPASSSFNLEVSSQPCTDPTRNGNASGFQMESPPSSLVNFASDSPREDPQVPQLQDSDVLAIASSAVVIPQLQDTRRQVIDQLAQLEDVVKRQQAEFARVSRDLARAKVQASRPGSRVETSSLLSPSNYLADLLAPTLSNFDETRRVDSEFLTRDVADGAERSERGEEDVDGGNDGMRSFWLSPRTDKNRRGEEDDDGGNDGMRSFWLSPRTDKNERGEEDVDGGNDGMRSFWLSPRTDKSIPRLEVVSSNGGGGSGGASSPIHNEQLLLQPLIATDTQSDVGEPEETFGAKRNPRSNASTETERLLPESAEVDASLASNMESLSLSVPNNNIQMQEPSESNNTRGSNPATFADNPAVANLREKRAALWQTMHETAAEHEKGRALLKRLDMVLGAAFRLLRSTRSHDFPLLALFEECLPLSLPCPVCTRTLTMDISDQ